MTLFEEKRPEYARRIEEMMRSDGVLLPGDSVKKICLGLALHLPPQIHLVRNPRIVATQDLDSVCAISIVNAGLSGPTRRKVAALATVGMLARLSRSKIQQYCQRIGDTTISEIETVVGMHGLVSGQAIPIGPKELAVIRALTPGSVLSWKMSCGLSNRYQTLAALAAAPKADVLQAIHAHSGGSDAVNKKDPQPVWAAISNMLQDFGIDLQKK